MGNHGTSRRPGQPTPISTKIRQIKRRSKRIPQMHPHINAFKGHNSQRTTRRRNSTSHNFTNHNHTIQ